MRYLLTILFAVCFAVSAFAAEPAAAPATPPADDCDACKANAAVMKAGKVQVTKLSNGTVVMVTEKGKKLEELKKAATDLDAVMKNAMEGKAKLDPNCTKMIEATKAGKVMMGKGELKDGVAFVTMTNDPEILKGLNEMADKLAAPPAKKK